MKGIISVLQANVAKFANSELDQASSNISTTLAQQAKVAKSEAVTSHDEGSFFLLLF